MLALLMLLTALFTNFVSNNAAAAVGTPIAIGIARQLGVKSVLEGSVRKSGDRLRIVTSRSHADATVESMCAALPVTDRRPSPL